MGLYIRGDVYTGWLIFGMLLIGLHSGGAYIRGWRGVGAYIRGGVLTEFYGMFDQLTKRLCRTVGSTLVAFLELLAYLRNVVILSRFSRYSGRWSSRSDEFAPRRYSRGIFGVYS